MKRKEYRLCFAAAGFWIWTFVFFGPFCAAVPVQLDSAYHRTFDQSDNGTTFLFLRNDLERPVRIERVFLNDLPLPPIVTSTTDRIRFSPTADIGTSTALPATEPRCEDHLTWYDVFPNPIPAKGICTIKMRWNYRPRLPISFKCETSENQWIRTLIPLTNPPILLSYIGFSPSRDRVYVYAENTGNVECVLRRVWLNGKDVTTRTDCRQLRLPARESVESPGARRRHDSQTCAVIDSGGPLDEGEYCTVKLEFSSSNSLTRVETAQATVRVRTGFPIGLELGSWVPESTLKLRPIGCKFEDLAFQERKVRPVFCRLLVCLAHKHGLPRAAGKKTLTRLYQVRASDALCPAAIHLCKLRQQEALRTYGAIADWVLTNIAESEVSRPRADTASVHPHPSQRLAGYYSRVNAPRPWLALMALTPDLRIPRFAKRPPGPEEVRMLAYYGLSRGARGLVYRFNSKSPRDAKVLSQVRQLNEEIAGVGDWLCAGQPVDRARSSTSGIEAVTYQIGYEGLLLMVINHKRDVQPVAGIRSRKSLRQKIQEEGEELVKDDPLLSDLARKRPDLLPKTARELPPVWLPQKNVEIVVRLPAGTDFQALEAVRGGASPARIIGTSEGTITLQIHEVETAEMYRILLIGTKQRIPLYREM